MTSDFMINKGVLTKYNGTRETVVVPEGVTAIAYRAFQNRALKKLILPDGIKEIREAAFKGCSELEEIRLPDSIQDIGVEAFADCIKLKEFVLPGNTLYLSPHVLNRCRLERVILHENVHYIGTFFNECDVKEIYVKPGSFAAQYILEFYKSKTRVIVNHVLPAGMKWPLTTLNYAEIQKGSAEKKSLNCYLQYCGADSRLVLPVGIKYIAPRAFMNCSTLKSIVLPDSVRVIGWQAFSGCTNLESMEIPYGVKTIETGLFQNCNHLRYVSLPETVTALNQSAFSKCQCLETMNIPSSVKSIDVSIMGDIREIDANKLLIYGNTLQAKNLAKSIGAKWKMGQPVGSYAPRTMGNGRYEQLCENVKKARVHDQYLIEQQINRAKEEERILQEKEAARRKAEEARRRAEEEERRRAEEEKRRAEAEEKRKEIEARRKAEETARKLAEEEQVRKRLQEKERLERRRKTAFEKAVIERENAENIRLKYKTSFLGTKAKKKREAMLRLKEMDEFISRRYADLIKED